jgi:hypothetical protein
MENANMPAMPMLDQEAKPCVVRDRETGSKLMASGLTKREMIAMHALQGLLANPGGPIQQSCMSGWSFTNCTESAVAELAVELADELLAKLK